MAHHHHLDGNRVGDENIQTLTAHEGKRITRSVWGELAVFGLLYVAQAALRLLFIRSWTAVAGTELASEFLDCRPCLVHVRRLKLSHEDQPQRVG